jgi:hypothetical protein
MNILLKNVDWIWPVSNWRHLELDFHAFSLDKKRSSAYECTAEKCGLDLGSLKLEFHAFSLAT